MDRITDHFDATEAQARVVASDLVMVAGYIDDPRSLGALGEQRPHHTGVRARPTPAAFGLPEVEKVTDQIKRVAAHGVEKIVEVIGFTVLESQMDVGYPDRSEIG